MVMIAMIFAFVSCTNNAQSQEDIQDLMRQMMNWVESKTKSRDYGLLTFSSLLRNDSAFIGYDMSKHKANIDSLKTTGFFANEFLENYDQIALTIDRKLRNKELEYPIGYLPPWGNGIFPWWSTQDVPYDNPNPWDHIEVSIISLHNDNAEAIWKYGIYALPGFSYNFRAVKENGKWKISYLQGFDYDNYFQHYP